MTRLAFTVNGREHEIEVEAPTLLVHAIREQIGLTGTHVGCLTGDCGACTMVVDGKTVKTCSILALSAEGSNIQTIESLADGEQLDPVQKAFWEEFAFQCGYCLPGMLLIAKELVDNDPEADESEILRAINGNLCRCTGYSTIVAAVRRALREAR